MNSLLDNTPSGDGLVTLREAITAANANTSTDLGHVGSGADTILFSATLSGTVNLSTIGNSAAGPSALNVTSPITIRGNSNGITLNAGAGATAMRHFRVAANGNLTLDTIMLTGGVARGTTGAAGQDGGDGRGGAIYNEGSLTVIATTLYSNKAVGGIAGAGGSGGVGRGGAIYNAAATVTIRNATFSGNQALNSSESAANSAFGGSIHGLNGNLQIFNSTLTNGTALSGKGVYVIANGGSGVTAHVESTIIGEVGGSSSQPDFTALQESELDPLVLTGSGNLIRRALNFNDVWDIDPLLAPLANNGGPTLTHALQPLSPAINSGINALNLTTDQRGTTFARVVAGTADVGSFEQQAAAAELVGDFNRDEHVDAADYVMWRKTRDTNVEAFSGADGNGDGHVDDEDYELWVEDFGSGVEGGSGGGASLQMAVTARGNDNPSLVEFHVRPAIPSGGLKSSTLRAPQFRQSTTSQGAALLAVLAEGGGRSDGDIGQSSCTFTTGGTDDAWLDVPDEERRWAKSVAIGEVWRW